MDQLQQRPLVQPALVPREVQAQPEFLQEQAVMHLQLEDGLVTTGLCSRHSPTELPETLTTTP
jgi:hypothetical protein